MKERNYGIDIFKMFSMYLVCVLHVLGQGGILSATEDLSVNYTVSWALELIAFVAVNCFALASGYVGIHARFRPRKLFSLWLTTVFYGLLFAVIFSVSSTAHIGIKGFAEALTPFISGTSAGYWYFTAYAVTFMLMPFLNNVINNSEKKKSAYLVLILLVLFSVIPAIRKFDCFNTAHGYSYVWISALYLVGGFIGKYDVFGKVRTKVLVILTAVSLTVSCAGHYILNWYIINFKQQISSQADFLANPYGNLMLKPATFANYTFPTTVITAVLLLVIFSRINVKNEFLKKRIVMYMPLVFSVYLIHTNNLVFSNVISGLFEGYAKLNPLLLAAAVLGTALAIFVICIMIDMLRFELFKLIKVDKLCEYTENRLRAFWNRLFNEKANEV